LQNSNVREDETTCFAREAFQAGKGSSFRFRTMLQPVEVISFELIFQIPDVPTLQIYNTVNANTISRILQITKVGLNAIQRKSIGIGRQGTQRQPPANCLPLNANAVLPVGVICQPKSRLKKFLLSLI
jgi:hypothetical protein